MSYILVDVETIGHPAAADFVPPPELDKITAARNLKDPVKVAEDIAKRREAAQVEYLAQLDRAALDWNLSRIVAIGWQIDGGEIKSLLCRDEAEEADALQAFWRLASSRTIVGFCTRTFDCPTLIQRSRLLGVKPNPISLGRYGRGSVIDLRDELTFDDARYEAIMPRSLKAFAKRFGLAVDDPVDGAQIGDFVKAGNWEAVRAHVESDIKLTAQLAERLGHLMAVEAF